MALGPSTQATDVPRRATPPKTADLLPAQDAEPEAAPSPAPKRVAPRKKPAKLTAGKGSANVEPLPGVLLEPPPGALLDPLPAARAPRPAKAVPAEAAAGSPVAKPAPRRRSAHITPVGALPPARIPREALVAPRHDKFLAYAVGVSLLLHAVVLTIHFKPFTFKDHADKGPPLEVALVNAKTVAKPTKADILAQANLDGGGNTDADRRAKSPLPVLPKNSPDQQVAVATQKVEALEKQTQELMTQLKAVPTVRAAQKPTEASEKTDLPTANELMQKTFEAIRLEAQIAKDMDAYQKRPKRRFIGARAEEYRFARYVEDWRLKIERVGNLNYPEAARTQKLYGSLLLTVSIRADGSVENVEINRTSGNRILDAAAVKIVEMSGPFAAFPPDIRRDTDVLHITRTWTFTKSDALVAN
jgi:protein TonB